MKVYSISKWAFYGICLLILFLPVSRHWRLLLGGATARGEAGPRRARGNKRCRNARLLASGYAFRYPTFREGYRAVIEDMA